MSQKFKIPAFPVDTHIHRLAQRWGLTDGKSVIQTEKISKRLFPKNPGVNFIFKLSIMEENIVKLENAMVLLVKSVLLVILKEKNL